MAWPWWRWVPKAGEEPPEGWSGSGSIPKTSPARSMAAVKEQILSPGCSRFTASYGACPIARPSAYLVTFTFGGWCRIEPPVYAEIDREKGQQLLLPCCSVWRTFGFVNQTAWKPAQLEAAADRCCRAAPSDRRAGRQPAIAKGSRATCGPFEGILRLERQLRVRPAVRRSARSGRSLPGSGALRQTAMACAAAARGPCRPRWVPMACTDLNTVSVAETR